MSNTASTYKSWLLAVSLAVIILLILSGGRSESELMDERAKRTNLEDYIGDLEVRSMLIWDSIDALNEQLLAVEKQKETTLKQYADKSRAEKNELIKRFGKVTIVNEQPCLDSSATDSINKLSIHYTSCVEGLNIKDSIIYQLTNLNANKDTIISVKDNIIAGIEKSHTAQKKAAKIELIKAAVVSGLVGFVIGLLL